MVISEKWALFDFCETLVNFQTADAFVDYVRMTTKSKRMMMLSFLIRIMNKIKVFTLIDKLVGDQLYLLKRCVLWQLRGFSEAKLECYAKEYYDSRIRPNLINLVVDRMLELKKGGFKVLLVSGGYSIYVKYFVNEYSLDGLIANEIDFKKQKCLGRIKGVNCMNKNKPILLDAFFVCKPQYTEAYSDSITDIPFLRWANKGVVVSKGKHQEWCGRYNFEEIVVS